MKKILISLVAVILLLAAVPVSAAVTKPEVTDHEKVVINMFRGNGCSACHAALEKLVELGDEYSDYVELKTYEVWYNQDNSTFLANLMDEFEIADDQRGVPFFVIGKKYFVGYSEENIFGTALELYKDKKYSDYVSTKATKEGVTLTSMTLTEAATEDGILESEEAKETKSNEGKYDTIIIIGIFVVLIGGIGALVIASKK